MIVMERQYRHAAREYLLEVPAGKMEEGEDALAGAKRELLEETGFQAKRWRKDAALLRQPRVSGRVDASVCRRRPDVEETRSRSTTSSSKSK
jgi:8-oxo-dGTP pyrophosphatase MutT (NUDIX family)